MIEHFHLIRGLHIVAVIAWMAGMLYLPRLYVYHTRAQAGSPMDETFKEMERKLLRLIINPAMIATVLLGSALVSIDLKRLGPMFWTAPWMLAKIGGIIGLLSYHGFLAASRRAFAQNRNQRSERFWRLTNEIPFGLMVVIVLSVTTKFGA